MKYTYSYDEWHLGRLEGEGERMLTAQERVQLMLDFAQMDLDRLRTGDWLNLREDLEAFI